MFNFFSIHYVNRNVRCFWNLNCVQQIEKITYWIQYRTLRFEWKNDGRKIAMYTLLHNVMLSPGIQSDFFAKKDTEVWVVFLWAMTDKKGLERGKEGQRAFLFLLVELLNCYWSRIQHKEYIENKVLSVAAICPFAEKKYTHSRVLWKPEKPCLRGTIFQPIFDVLESSILHIKKGFLFYESVQFFFTFHLPECNILGVRY